MVDTLLLGRGTCHPLMKRRLLLLPLLSTPTSLLPSTPSSSMGCWNSLKSK